ncbi:vacuolar protein sorting-associated protein 8 [Geosmithia morbida]|uniref:Vacuolar protein sorting-associated protein 8 n=1 Tax=Geosmithia morbida TaxID=1094350 RepID=A0A9P4Z0F7_9HYPO|nr:vacuolar protein sorting-associated protein 8 [Geosmithia morbida]KAF4125137.1 vacuolar protein sorting-associated protein 8 [Geosmithia morbida]
MAESNHIPVETEDRDKGDVITATATAAAADDVPHLDQDQQQQTGADSPAHDDDDDTHAPRNGASPLQYDGEGGSSVGGADSPDLMTASRRVDSPIDSVLSGLDEAASMQGSVMSSPGSSMLPSVASRAALGSPTPSFRPFDRRFKSRISSPSSGLQSPRASSPALVNSHSRNASVSSNFNLVLDQHDTDSQSSPPWDVVRWTRLTKLNAQAFSEAGRRSFGSPTCLAVSASIVLGTSKGIILIFDYGQNLKMILGPGTKAVESGPITAVAISADHSTVAGGHANGDIFTWDMSRASRPFLTIPHIGQAQADARTADGHVPNAAVTHLGFLGIRHTALVSADERGMAFSHLATRGTGALGRTVRTTRILGRYPGASPPPGKPIKPSTVLAFSPLPLGNVERSTDAMGLTAMLTPYLLVIVSTTPVAQTQHKSARPKDVAAHSPMTGCLAWFPAVKLKVADPHTASDISKVKLAYCWSNVLTVLDVDEVHGEDRDQPPALRFKPRSRWRCEEAIASVQWLSRSVLTVLTLSQRLIVLEDRSMRMTEAFDLINRHVYHADLFSRQLHSLVEQLDDEDEAMHGVVGDAFYMSFKTYKGRIFLLGFNEVSIGALSNWADRLIALMEHGDYIAAIQLATSYYTGDTDKLTVGLPDDPSLRHSMVRDKIMEIMSASLKYAFHRRQRDPQSAGDHHLRQLAETCFVACQHVGDTDYLFDEMYEWYDDADVEGIFLETLEPYILDGSITIAPPAVVRDMVAYYVSNGWETRLEEIICHMETTTLDLDQTTLLCKQHGLYDALIYVWNHAIGDYVTPMIDLLSLLIPFVTDGNEAIDIGEDHFGVHALKVFPYLSYVLTSRIYPNGEPMDEDAATKAKAEIYWFLFSGKTIAWPKEGGREFLTLSAEESQPSFPYLRLILRFDAPSLLSTLNEAFEDSFLNDSPDKQINGGSSRVDMPEEQIFGQTINRQYIVSILLDVMNHDDFAPEDTIYLDMFIARNLPKFPQYLLFSGSTLSQVLTGLCNFPGRDLAEDAQLSAEYLLSVYHPSDMETLIPLFKKAGFYRILKRVYKVDKQYGKLVETYFEDPEDQELVFDCIADCLRRQSGLNKRQVDDVLGAVQRHGRDLLELDPEQAAQTLHEQATDLHMHILDSVADDPELQHGYLRSLLEPRENHARAGDGKAADRGLVERYVQLMCSYEPAHVSDYIGTVQSINLRLDRLLPTMEETGVINAAVVLMAQDGQVREALDRLVEHLGSLESALQGLLRSANTADDASSVDLDVTTVEELLLDLQKYVYVGIWLCQGQTKSSSSTRKSHVVQKNKANGEGAATAVGALSIDEALWLNLVNACVQVTRRLSGPIHALAEPGHDGFDGEKMLALLRSLVQHTFTALLTATSSSSSGQANGGGGGGGGGRGKVLSNVGSNLSFLRILRAFLTQAAAESPNLADLRGVLTSIFAAYAYEESILRLSNRLLDRSLYVNVNQAVNLRQRGWRPRGSTCEACGRRVWGPGVPGRAVFEAWEERQALDEEVQKERKARVRERAIASGRAADGKGKGKSLDTRPPGMLVGPAAAAAAASAADPDADDGTAAAVAAVAAQNNPPLEPLVVLACRHIYHRSCLDVVQEKQNHDHHVGSDRDARIGQKRRRKLWSYSFGRKTTNRRSGQTRIHARMPPSSGEEEDDEDPCMSSDRESSSGSSSGQESPPQPPSQNLFAPPFYGRPPTPLPPSPSLTSLLRPSRPTTPDESDDDHDNNINISNSNRSNRSNIAVEPVRRAAAPRVPTYEYYGFVLYLFSSLAFLVYLLWSYLPSPFLHALGIYYYPNRWWALAVPAFLVMTLVYIYVALAAYNTEMLTVPLTSPETIVDGAGTTAVIDSKGRLKAGGAAAREKAKSGLPKCDRDGRLRWREIWNEGTDAVMDIPLGGVCEVLYGEGREDCGYEDMT